MFPLVYCVSYWLYISFCSRGLEIDSAAIPTKKSNDAEVASEIINNPPCKYIYA